MTLCTKTLGIMVVSYMCNVMQDFTVNSKGPVRNLLEVTTQLRDLGAGRRCPQASAALEADTSRGPVQSPCHTP